MGKSSAKEVQGVQKNKEKEQKYRRDFRLNGRLGVGVVRIWEKRLCIDGERLALVFSIVLFSVFNPLLVSEQHSSTYSYLVPWL